MGKALQVSVSGHCKTCGVNGVYIVRQMCKCVGVSKVA